jgi:uncharacterized protein YqjF (DUF2071 family)
VANDFDKSIIERVAHRPWPMPESPWVMTQTWHDLLFAHWPVAYSALRPIVPSAFELDTCERSAWIGVVPFYMTNVAPRGVPALPAISEFPELNVRTYVRVGDRAGVYFFSLDAGSSMAVRAARLLLNLPYFSAEMTAASEGPAIAYTSRRHDHPRLALFQATYEPVASPSTPSPGSLEYFLTERYCLYNLDRRGRPYRLDIHHPPWSLQRADAAIVKNTMADAAGVTLPDVAPLLHFAKRQDTVAWAPVAP